jgi:hypothetical protein
VKGTSIRNADEDKHPRTRAVSPGKERNWPWRLECS